jgi:putative transposase
MEMTNEIRTGRHCVFNLHVHLVFVTKYRRRVFTKTILDRMEDVLKTVCMDFEAELKEFDGEKDHVHLLINYPPKVPISKLVNSLKGVSSRLLRKGVLWSPSYFAASCGGAPISAVKQYIQSQSTPA